FLNSMSSIITIYKGKIVKNGGDNLFFYFPKTSDISNDSSFREALNCTFAMKSACTELNTELGKAELPPIKFRISMEYGEVEIAISSTVNYIDLFGHVVNYCSKLNGVASPDNVLLGITLYNIILNKGFVSQYRLEKIDLSTQRLWYTTGFCVFYFSKTHN